MGSNFRLLLVEDIWVCFACFEKTLVPCGIWRLMAMSIKRQDFGDPPVKNFKIPTVQNLLISTRSCCPPRQTSNIRVISFERRDVFSEGFC